MTEVVTAPKKTEKTPKEYPRPRHKQYNDNSISQLDSNGFSLCNLEFCKYQIQVKTP